MALITLVLVYWVVFPETGWTWPIGTFWTMALHTYAIVSDLT